MSKSTRQDDDGLDKRAKQVFIALRCLDDPENESDVLHELSQVAKAARLINEPKSLDPPRRGARWEYVGVKTSLHKLVPRLSADEVSPSVKGQAHLAKELLEAWHEAECLALSPYSMSRLKQLPELQQIISHTTLDAIQASARTLEHLNAAAQSREDTKRIQRHNLGKGARLSRGKLTERELGAAALTSAGPPRGPFSGFRRQKWQQRVKDNDSVVLLQQLVPGLRLCLAAEVAVGMLCPGQPPPPDTPEHAAALQMFVAEAFRHVQHELQDPQLDLLAQAGLLSSLADSSHHNAAAAIRDMWAHMRRPQHESREGPAELRPPNLADMPSWDLAPHVDLQMQLPPQQQLQLLCQVSDVSRQQQLHKGGDDQPGDCSSCNQHSSSCQTTSRSEQASHGIAATVAAAAAAAAAAAGSADQLYGAVPPDIQQLSKSSLQGLTALAADLLPILETYAELSAQSSSSSTIPPADLLLQALLSTCKTPEASEVVATACQSVRQQYTADRGAQEAAVGMTTEQLAAVLLQLAASVATTVTAGVSQDKQQSGNSAAASDSPLVSSSSDYQSAEKPVDKTALYTWVSVFAVFICRNLVLKFITDQWAACACNAAAPAWQQAVPLQVLLLQAFMRQIEACVLNLPGDEAVQQQQQQQQRGSGSNSSSSGEQVHQQQHDQAGITLPSSLGTCQPEHSLLLLMSNVQGMVHALRVFTATNAAINQEAATDRQANANSNTSLATGSNRVSTAAAATAAAAGDSSDTDGVLASADRALSPLDLFAADSRLAAGLWALSEPAGAGIWAEHGHSRSSSSHSSLLQQQEQGGLGSAAFKAPQLSQEQERSRLQQSIWQVSLAIGCWTQAVDQADTAATKHIMSGAFQDVAASNSYAYARRVLNELHSCSDLEEYMCDMYSMEPDPGVTQEAKVLWDQLQQEGVEVSDVGLYAATAAGQMCADSLAISHGEILQQLGIVSTQAKRSDVLRKKWRVEDMNARFQEQGAPPFKLGSYTPKDLDTAFALTSDEENEEDGLPRQQQSRRRASWGSHDSDCPSSGTQGLMADVFAATAAAGTSPAAESSPVAAGASAADRHSRRAELKAAQEAYMQVAAAATSQLLPLYRWHMLWLEDYTTKTVEAKRWWRSALREVLAKSAAADKPLPEWAQKDLSKMGSGGSKSLPRPLMQPAAAGSGVHNGESSSSTSSCRTGNCRAGQHDYNLNCPLCRQEQQQQDGLDGDGSSSSSSLFPNLAVPFDDPFLWRRLLWQLLGKLSPEAQAFYAHYMAMCPHCSDNNIWMQCIQPSVLQNLWSPPTFDAVALQLVAAIPHEENTSRSKRVSQYATALNSAYVQGHLPGLVVLAQQLLISLSPLHAQVLPRPEVAFLVPSSFRPAIGKALQQQLLSRPMLDLFQHGRAVLQMWHVWWHIGIRRYGALTQQQQQHSACDQQQQEALQQQQQRQGQNIEEFYMNPDARLYAVSYAMRQLCGTAADDGEQAAILGAPGSIKTLAAVTEATAKLKRTLLLNNLKATDEQLADRLIAQFSTGASPDSQAGGVWGLDSQGGSGSHDLQARGPESPEVQADNAGIRQAGPGSSEAAAALEQMVMINSKDELLLKRAIAWPRDMLAPLCARLGVGNATFPQQKALISTYLDSSVADVLKHMPDAVTVDEDDSEEAGEEQKEEVEQQQDGQQRPVWADKLTDMSVLALQPPVPLDAFVDPQLWLDRQQQLLDLDNKCAGCNAPYKVAMKVCPKCSHVRYCNDACMERDAKEHSVMCQRLATVLQNSGEGVFSGLIRLLHAHPYDSTTFGLDDAGLAERLIEPLMTREGFVQQASALLVEHQPRAGDA